MADGAPACEVEARLAELIDVVVAIASNDFDKRATVGDGHHLLDGLATGLNMLAEEIAQRHAREHAFQQRLLQHERLLAVGQLAAGVAHEVNNPATFVLANLGVLDEHLARVEQLLQADAPAGERTLALQLLLQSRELTRDNLEGVERVVAIVRNLRNFARLEPAQVESLSLADVIADACRLVRAELNYRARLLVSSAADLHVRGDRTKLVQVFTNLLMNAAQAILEGAPDRNEVAVTADIRGVQAVVTVRDTGTGFTPEAQARLFEPFVTTNPREHGTGLGLALSADIVRHHGGQLRLLDTSAAGTTFEVVLPLDGPPATSTPAVTPVPAPTPAARPRVLVIDDEPMLLAAYERFFGPHFELTLLPGGREAVTKLESDGDWDAIVCDLMMPDLDGAALYDWLQLHRPDLLGCVLFCTGGAFTPRSLAFAERMGDHLLQKPLRPGELRAAVERVRRRGR
ncbi:MAG: ATP-binding protein [Candidatus Eisenbacteria bacterium]